MSLVGASIAAPLAAATNPIDGFLLAFNTNPYFIGIMMLLLNLGGRFLSMEITKEQEKFFQNTFVRAFLLFVVMFVATRNVIVAFWLTLIVVVLLRFLFNENSDYYLFKKEGFQTGVENPAPAMLLTPEEADIYQKLGAKLAKLQAAKDEKKKAPAKSYDIGQVYSQNMGKLNLNW